MKVAIKRFYNWDCSQQIEVYDSYDNALKSITDKYSGCKIEISKDPKEETKAFICVGNLNGIVDFFIEEKEVLTG